MKENIVKNKSLEFAIKVVRMNQILTSELKEFVMSKQVLRRGTSVAAMVRKAEHAELKATDSLVTILFSCILPTSIHR